MEEQEAGSDRDGVGGGSGFGVSDEVLDENR